MSLAGNDVARTQRWFELAPTQALRSCCTVAGAIPRTELLTVEGERDDICSVEQTAAVHDLRKGRRPHLRRHRLQAGVGHYGMFSGKRWNGQIYPVIRYC